MAADVSSPEPGPPVVQPPSPAKRWFISWKLWLVGLFLGIAGIGLSLMFPLLLRWRAIVYFEAHAELDYYHPEPEWAKNLGNWSIALRQYRNLRCGQADDSTLRRIGRLPELWALWVEEREGSPITDDGLASLEGLSELRDVWLFGEGFTDAGLARIFAARQPLRTVVLVHTGAGRETLQALSRIPTITNLTIISETLTDEDFRDLPALPNLSQFSVDGLGDLGADWLSRSSPVYDVHLYRSSVTDEGIRLLCDIPKVQYLSLRGAALTPTSLWLLGGCGFQCSLDLTDARYLSPDDIASLPLDSDASISQLAAELLSPESIERVDASRSLSLHHYSGEVTDPEVRAILDGRSNWLSEQDSDFWREDEVTRRRIDSLHFGQEELEEALFGP